MALQTSEFLDRVSPDWIKDGTRRRRIGGMLSLGLAIAAPICAILTFALMPDAGPFSGDSMAVRVLLIVDFCLAIALMGVIAWRIATLVLARRARSAGSRLHLRMVRLFTVVAVLPAMLLGLFAAVTVTFGLEGWLNQRVAGVVRNSVDIAESYVRERHQAIRLDASVIASEIARAAPYGALDGAEIARILAQVSVQRRLVEVYVVNGEGEIIARGPNSYLFLYDPPTRAQFARTREGEVVVFDDGGEASIRALAPLPGLFDAYLYLSRPVDGEALRILAQTREMAARYEALETQRGDIQLLFAMLYLGFAVLLLSAAIWFGIWFADRLARPIGRLAGAADRVAKGDLNARVDEERSDDEIATLSRAFNRMTEQVKRQRDALLDANAQIDQRRRFTEAVLSGVTAGVIGLDKDGRVDLANASANALLHLEPGALDDVDLGAQVPAFGEIVTASRHAVGGVAEGRARINNEDGDSDFLVRVACQRRSGRIEGYVVTFDDMTELASAQRSAAWGDVARRVAHEIRNPLTPIQLSAERLKRKFGRQIETDRPVFEHCVDTIVRQVEQIRRMVEEFSNFARMPKPRFAEENPAALVRDAVALQSEAHPEIAFAIQDDASGRTLRCDRGLLTQALTNLLKNAAEAVAARIERDRAEQDGDPAPGRVTATLQDAPGALRIAVTDNGVGLPRRERKQLTEPYVTTRKRGTGLGLAIVKRIAEEHGGTLTLEDAPDGAGARVSLLLPLEAAPPGEAEPQQTETDDRPPANAANQEA